MNTSNCLVWAVSLIEGAAFQLCSSAMSEHRSISVQCSLCVPPQRWIGAGTRNVLVNNDNDVKLINAEYSMMGQGNFYQSQKEYFSVLKLIDFSKDNAILNTAKTDAKNIIDNDNNLSDKKHRTLGFEIARIWR